MSVRYYLSKIYGDGDIDAPEPWGPTVGAFRPAINDVLDPDTGTQAFVARYSIGVDSQTGLPNKPWVLVAAKGDKHRLLNGHTDITHVADQGVKDVKIGAMEDPKRQTMLSMLTDKGVDLTGFDNAASHRQIMAKMVTDSDPAITLDDIDFPD